MPSKYCDLVMKGGITSGLVYPKAALALSKTYRFKNIGGTSAGAIAAAVVAAAAVGDRKKHATPALSSEDLGFDGLQKVAKELTTRRFIYNLFQPALGTGNAYRFVVVMAAGTDTLLGKIRKWLAPFVAVISIAPTRTVLVLLVLLGLAYRFGDVAGVKGAFIPAFLCALASGGWFSINKTAALVRKNRMGLCSGRTVERTFQAKKDGLTDWLHKRLQSLSGKPDDAPLTFADLWQAPRYADEPATTHALTLQMITSCLSHNEPRTVPFSNGAFWFTRADFDLLFPKPVVDAMVKEDRKKRIGEVTYYPLPQGGDLPVLVGMRMSLSFPLLISAVPLYEADKWAGVEKVNDVQTPDLESEAVETSLQASTSSLSMGGKRGAGKVETFRVCWFSDGGISSNFPVHLFDGPLPHWPTFAIDLIDKKDAAASEKRGDVYLPQGNNEGWQRRHNGIAEKSATKEVINFLFSIISTMQNWRDLLQSRAPGYRDRIVQVTLTPDEGGLNLDMPQPTLDNIASKGELAGLAFNNFSFENHYWIRWRNLAAAFQGYAKRVALTPQPPVPDYAGAFALGQDPTTEEPSYGFKSPERRQEATKIINDIVEKGEEWTDDPKTDVTKTAPNPRPQMTITPTF